ncbi:MAG: hypothetical protein LAO51_10080 [Acidobacteriia bacterium]|nr:hypothetical protein [Terriglobia bacterium]
MENHPVDGIERFTATGARVIDWCRVKELCPPFTKGDVFRKLKNGMLRGKKLNGVLLIDGRSVRDLIANSPAWKPKKTLP